jgi:hypothetical protein
MNDDITIIIRYTSLLVKDTVKNFTTEAQRTQRRQGERRFYECVPDMKHFRKNSPLSSADFVTQIEEDRNQKKISENPRWNLRQSFNDDYIVVATLIRVTPNSGAEKYNPQCS